MANDQGSLNWLKTALEMEEKGKAHYDKAAEQSRDEAGREIFKMLSDYEVQHQERIREIYAKLQGGSDWTKELAEFEAVTDLTSVFRKLAEKQEKQKAEANEVEALDIGMEFESASVKFYEDHARTTDNPLEKRFLELLTAEERGHMQVLGDMKLYYTDPETWYMEKDRVSLDGA